VSPPARHWTDRYRKAIIVALCLAVAGGVAALLRLPVGLFPRATFPRLEVSLDAGDRPADQMVLEVTRPVEETVRGVPGARSIRSNTSRGSADISINFDWGHDMVAAALQVEAAINQARGDLPAGLGFEVRRMDPTVFPVLGLSLTSDSLTPVELQDIATYRIRPMLAAVDGVAAVRVLGGRSAELQVLIDPDRLEALDMAVDEVVNAVSAAQAVEAVGRLEQSEKLYLVLANNRITGADTLRDLIIRRGSGGIVRLDDVAEVVEGESPAWTRVVADGHDAVLLNVYQQPDGNTVAVSKDVRARLMEAERALPPGVKVSTWYDQSDLITASAASVRDSILIGVALAVIVLVVFLRNLRIAFVVVLVVPAVLAATALALVGASSSLNIMTLGGMAAAVGLVIDDAIVMVEHIVKRVQQSDHWSAQQTHHAAGEMFRALTMSSLATTLIFVPLAWLSGVTGAFFKALSITMAAALAISYLFALTGVPVLAGALIHRKDANAGQGGGGFDRVVQRYARLLRRLLDRPSLLLVGLVPLVLVGGLAFRSVGSGFMPVMDEGGFILDYRTPAGTSLAETDRRLRVLESVLSEVPEIDTWSRRTGLALGGFITEANEGDYFIRLKPPPRRSIDQVMDDVRAGAEARVPGVEIELAQLMEDLIGDLTSVPQPIEVKLYGPDPTQLRARAEDVAKAVASVADTVDVKSGVVLAGDALNVTVNRERAATLGLDAEQVAKLARVALDGEVVTRFQRGSKMVDVRVWTTEEARRDSDRFGALRMWTPLAGPVALDRVASFVAEHGQPQIVREDLRTMVAVTGRISGRDLGSVMRDVKAAVAGLSLPPTISVAYGGLYAQQQASFKGLLAVLGSAVALLFLLLLVAYRNFSAPVAIMSTSIACLTAVFVGLKLTGTELNIAAMMGLTMVVGITAEAAIFLVTTFYENVESRPVVDSLVDAGVERARPIVMTALAAILALLPLAMGIGQGAEMLRPLAIAIIAGLMAAIPLVLLVTPALLRVLGGRGAEPGSSEGGAVPDPTGAANAAPPDTEG